MDLSAASLDAEIAQELDESGGIERVPMADPGLDVRHFISSVYRHETTLIDMNSIHTPKLCMNSYPLP